MSIWTDDADDDGDDDDDDGADDDNDYCFDYDDAMIMVNRVNPKSESLNLM